MIRKLLIIRKPQFNTDVLKEVGLDMLVQGKPLDISPKAWAEEAGLSHYGFVMEMKLKDYEEKLKKFMNSGTKVANASTLLDLEEDVETSLSSIGLRVHPDSE